MFSPHGPQAPSVYWRRRLVLLTSVVVLVALVALTLRVVFGDEGATATATSSSPVTTPSTSTQTTKYVPPSSSAARRSAGSPVTRQSTPTAPGTSPESARTCDLSKLAIVAVTDHASYPVGAEPVLMMQVTNTASVPCVQDLADRQILLRVYNGESRVWGSHDCKTLPGVDDRVLRPKAPIRISVVWSGLSARPNCGGTRQRVGVGTYTLYATLAGKLGEAAQFAIN